MSKVLTAPQLPAGRRATVDDQGGNSELDLIVEEISGGGGGVPVPAASHIVFASPLFGNDTTGDGTAGTPYATIAHSYSTITTASAVEIWQVILFGGEYVEDVALKPFIYVEGWDKSQQTSQVIPAHINGNVTLDAGFSASGATARVTSVDIDGTTTLDFVAASSADGSVSFTNCQFEVNTVLTQGPSNSTEMHGCTLLDDCVQLGGAMAWKHTRGGTGGSSTLRIAATTGAAASGALFTADNSCWIGNVHADQNGNGTGGQIVQIDLDNSQFRGGTLTITAAVDNNPVINCEYGAVPENPVLAGSAAVALSSEMRVWQALTVPSGTVIEGLSAADVPILLTGGVLGATSIEDMSCDFTPRGDVWATELAQHQLSWSFYVKQTSGPSVAQVHVVIFNPSDTTVTTAAALPLLFYAFLPTVV